MPCRADGLGTGLGPMTDVEYLQMQMSANRQYEDPIKKEFLLVLKLYRELIPQSKRDPVMDIWVSRGSTDDYTKKNLDFATSHLCAYMKSLSTTKRLTACRYVKGLSQWWTNHKRVDKRRELEEKRNKVRKQALAKLTKEERKILGL